ncbi:MAG: hypothetical protein LBG15_13375 [Dysgonamonadaceae bacterium]|jgi:hypothetical protein|nr:hypothetical protein [Dysgonamonadaceae bacterium]
MKTGRVILILAVIGCLLVLNIRLMHVNRQERKAREQDKILVETLNRELGKTSNLLEFEYLYKASKEMTVFRLQYELYPLANSKVYLGADKSKVFPIENLIDRPKLVFGSSQNST